jgi:hypothetical protein
VLAPWIATGETPGSLSSPAMSPTTKTSGGRQAQVALDHHPAAAVERGVGLLGELRPSGDAATPAGPDLGLRQDAPGAAVAVLHVDAVRVDVDDLGVELHLDADALSSCAACADSLSPKVPSTARCRVERGRRASSPGRWRAGSCCAACGATARRSGRPSHPVGPAPTTTKVSQASSSAASVVSSAIS